MDQLTRSNEPEASVLTNFSLGAGRVRRTELKGQVLIAGTALRVLRTIGT